jgi:AraC-like DNA-binding protein
MAHLMHSASQAPTASRVIDEPISDLHRIEIATIIADTLRRLAGASDDRLSIDLEAVEAVRAYLAAHPSEQTPARTLERLSGIDRFSIARYFRRAFGTSPDRYRTLRRLALARSAIESGVSLAAAAAEAGFADQSHMTRQFKRTYGMTPARWASAVVSGRAPRRNRQPGLPGGVGC